ncbi:uncharacterized protein LACBIDRAFT_307381 [Laccaria bicolor S238N-H82]|uniref:Predicted protein n=1 Tax=Laccaria bicolor (strain S238N-H82 / ATCC MYA-4686) TaxID=486041 RepID=B0DQ04_LACBS|nr:uncharacterized protein LACBIDRAFT_307381 [Laccaria bicolor S238N-H82]EDR03207.1 predicted protein [Laccaria bicolor S238N-H82]|eukprot:XP_001886003.1 predicted protein [Laccaria bicolor S238N-H82]
MSALYSRSKHTKSSSNPYAPTAGSLTLAHGAVDEEATEFFVHPFHNQYEGGDVGNSDDALTENKARKLPWWKTPSPWWLLTILPFTSIAMSAMMAPRIEIYTTLACRVHKPDIFEQSFPGLELGLVDAFEVFGQLPHRNGSAGLFIDQIYRPRLTDNSVRTTRESPTTKPNRCASDPVVQAAVAKLTAVIEAFTGILSCITAGWWGAFSDRHGRLTIMGITVFGLLLTDFNFIMVALFPNRIPGGYWFLTVGPAVEGSLGGVTSAIAAMHAYLADTTDEGSRSRILSLNLGLVFTGMAVGPMAGGLLIRFTGYTLSVFYVAFAIHIIYAFLIWVVVPESVSMKDMDAAKVKYNEEMGNSARERESETSVGFFVRLKRIFSFLSPLTIFMPEIEKSEGRKPRRNWNLALMAIGYGSTISVMGSYSFKFQYAASAFGWSSETIGYWLSLVGAARAVFLTFLLPVIIKVFKPKPLIVEFPSSPAEAQPLLSSESSTSGVSSPPIRKEIHSPAFDLGLAQASLLIEIISYLFMGLAPTPVSFTVFGMLSAIGSGFSPAVQSVTLAMYSRKGGVEVGRLFGALSVVQALCSQIIGPSLYGYVYMRTVATFPRAIFFMTVASVVFSFFLFSLVRLPRDTPPPPVITYTDVDAEEPETPH